MRVTLCILLLLPALALADGHSAGGGKGKHSGGLSEQEITALRAGKGMGMARSAHQNEYPGPRHVLELAEQLDLDDQQMQQTQVLFADMKRSAMALGEKIIAAEAELDAAFTRDSVDADAVKASLLEIGRLRAELRFVHIETHLKQRDVLSDAQVAAYYEARASTHGQHGQGKGGHGKGGQGKGGHGKSGQGKGGHGKHKKGEAGQS